MIKEVKMNKLEVQQRVLKDGKPLDLDKFSWDEDTKTFSSSYDELVLDFSNIDYCTFKTGPGCTFNTGSYCTFNTGSDCTFDTGESCTFDTESDCTFKTGANCTFDTWWKCTFKTGPGCTFKTGPYCTFNTGEHCTFKTGPYCTFDTESNCTFNTGEHCTFKTHNDCTFDTASDCTFDTWSECTFYTWWDCIFDTGEHCTFKTRSGCTFKTYNDCTFATGSHCKFKTGVQCMFRTDPYCTFDTGANCMFRTDPYCTFDTGANCTFNTGSDCTFNTGGECVIIRRDVFEVIQPEDRQTIQLFPFNIPGHLVDGMYKGEPHVIVDNIVSKVVHKRGNVSKVINLGSDKETYLVRDGDVYAHGDTLKEARDSLVYKIGDRDTSDYENYTLETAVMKTEAIKMYRVITGSCEAGVRQFVEAQNSNKKRFKIKDIIELTVGQYGHETFKEFFRGGLDEI